MHLGSLLTRNARHRGGHLAFTFGDLRLTYRELNARVNQVANGLLALGLRKGDKIATVLPNCPEQLEIYWAVAKTGLVVVPLSPLLRGPGLASLLEDSDATAVVTSQATAAAVESVRDQLTKLGPGRYLLVDGPRPGWDDYHRLTDPASAREPPDAGLSGDDPYNIIYSSGTTGLPKGIVHTHQIRCMYGYMAATFNIRPDSVLLQTGSIVFNGSFILMLACLYQGGTMHLHPKFDVGAFIEAVARERVTAAMLVPSQIVAILADQRATAEALGTLETILSLGAPLLLEHKLALMRLLPRRLYELYGLTEGFSTVLDRDDVPRKPGSVGTPLQHSELWIAGEDGQELPPGEVGEIVGRSEHLMPGYYKRPDLTAQAVRGGWLFTGDVGYVDEDGFLYLVDRKKDMILSGGVNVYPRDIEEIAIQHPAVRDAAAFGVPDERWGEVPVVAVLLAQPVESEAIKQWINARVAARYQEVKDVLVMEDFPRNVAGKTLKRELRDQFWQGTSRRI